MPTRPGTPASTSPAGSDAGRAAAVGRRTSCSLACATSISATASMSPACRAPAWTHPRDVKNGWFGVQVVTKSPATTRTRDAVVRQKTRTTRRWTMVPVASSYDGTRSPGLIVSIERHPTMVPAGKHSSRTTRLAGGRASRASRVWTVETWIRACGRMGSPGAMIPTLSSPTMRARAAAAWCTSSMRCAIQSAVPVPAVAHAAAVMVLPPPVGMTRHTRSLVMRSSAACWYGLRFIR